MLVTLYEGLIQTGENNRSQDRLDFLKMQITESINIYKHPQELFLKWIGIYGAVIAAIGVYIFNNELTPYGKRLIPVLTVLGSLAVILGCTSMLLWINKHEIWVNQILEEVGVAPSPFFGGKRLIFLMLLVITGAFFVSLFVLIRWEIIFK